MAITITGGAAASRGGTRWSVPKRDLVAAAQVALQSKRLKIAASLPAAQLLVDELTAYRVTISDAGRDSYGNGRESVNDDLVLALSLAVYTAGSTRGRGRGSRTPDWTRHSNERWPKPVMERSGADSSDEQPMEPTGG